MTVKRCPHCQQEKGLDAYSSGNGRYKRHAICKSCDSKRVITWQRENKSKYRLKQKKWKQRLKAEFIAAYGGACTCCGEKNPGFLTLEHLKGREPGDHYRAAEAHARAKRAGWSKDITTLCFNCNMGKARNNGVCPHKEVT